MLKKRHPVASFLEIALPCLVILVLGLLKSLVTDVQVPDGWSDGINTNGNSSQGTSYNLYKMSGTTLSDFPAMLPKFTMHETSMWGILLFMGNLSVSLGKNMNELPVSDLEICTKGVAIQGLVDLAPSSRYALPSSCNGKVAPYKIAVAPDNTFTRDYFMRTMELWYPRIELQPNTSHSAVIPSLLESVQFFKTEQALEEYVKGNDYASSQAKPRIYGGIVFDKYPNEDQIGSFQDIEYTVRLNSTLVPKTGGSPPQVSPFQKSIETEYYTQYATTGFMTLQTLVTRFVTCMPKWNATTKTTTGECQNPQTTAKASIETDTVLLATLENDPILSSVLKPMAGLNPPFSPLSQLLSNDTTAKLLKPLRQAPQPSLGASVAPFPIKSYVRSGFYDQVATVLALILLLSYLYSISRLLVVLIQEKEKRLREYMKILGVHEHAIVLSWYLTYSFMVLCGSVLQTLMGSFGLFASSSIAMIFVFFFFFGLTVLSFGFLISTIFSQARVGTFVGMVLFFLMYFVSSAIKSTTSESLKTAASIFSPVGLSLGLNIISKLEATGTGVHFANASDLTDNYRFTRVLFMFVLDTVLYTLLGLYCENVVPKDHGTTLKWYFPLSPAYWKRCSKRFESLSKGLLDNVSMEVEDHPHVEPVSAELRAQEERGDVLTVQGLRKVFAVPGGEKIAVQGLSVTMYKHQITCLLGHNGAGKTTLISMLTGMVAPTSGDAFFRGLSIRNNMNEIRRSLGICFQHDVLFDELTVEEHLRFFGRIKGYNSAELEAVITQQLQEVGLTEKRHVKSTQLSGGMKRKLSVAVSLLGDSSLVFLDEPTSGMDPYSRRSTWEMLLKARQDRVMVLTTHFMDEADILGDRIAIMVEGELRCCGSSLFLKNRFGAGYTLTLVKDEAVSNAHNVIDFVTSHVPSAQVLSHVGSELAFQLPLASSSSFAAMFAALDEQLKDFGVLSYGISVTTLEEVFI